MLNLDEACESMVSKFPQFLYFEGIAELPDKFIITPLDEEGEEMDSPPYSVSKITGTVNVYLPQENRREFLKAKKRKVPKKYLYK